MLSPDVRAGWCAWTRQWEGSIAWPYLDVRGLVTVGLGCLVADLMTFVGLPWGRTASAEPLTYCVAWDPLTYCVAWDPLTYGMAWDRLRAMPAGLPAARYASATGLVLSAAAIDELALARLDADVAQLERTLGDLSALPDAAAQVVCSLAWACGAGWPATWPHLRAAVLARDWAACVAPEVPARTHPDGRPVLVCDLDEHANAGVRARNLAVEELLRGLVTA